MIRLADVRLLAPVPVRRVCLVGDLDSWRSGLAAAGIEVVDRDPDLVVTVPGLEGRAADMGAPAVIVLGRARRILRRTGYSTREYLVRPGRDGPRVYVPLEARTAAAHALLSPIQGRGWAKRLAVRVVLAVLRTGLPLGLTITVAGREPRPPWLLSSALGAAGVEVGPEWYLLTGDGDDLQRIVWLCFGPNGSQPAWAVKCSRVPGNDAPFEAEESALGALDSLPSSLRRHAPRVLVRTRIDRLPFAVETAATGQPLHLLLPEASETQAFRLIGSIADWIVALAHATRRPPGELAPELARLEHAVVPAWASEGVRRGLTDSLPPLPGVLQHNDLGCWNILVHCGRFTVIDWEASRQAGLPLWDVVYFLVDALSTREAPHGGSAKDRAVLALLRGELDTSAFLFDRVRTAADTLDVPRDAIGPITTLGWLHHGLAGTERADVGGKYGAVTTRASNIGPLEELARPWLSDPSLGLAWPALSAAAEP